VVLSVRSLLQPPVTSPRLGPNVFAINVISSAISLCSTLNRETKFRTQTEQHTSFIIQPVLIPTFLDTKSKKKYSSFPFLLSCDIFFSSHLYPIQPYIQYVSRGFPRFCATDIVSPRCNRDISTQRSEPNPPVTHSRHFCVIMYAHSNHHISSPFPAT